MSRAPSPKEPRSRSSRTIAGMRAADLGEQRRGPAGIVRQLGLAHVVPAPAEGEVERLGEQRVVVEDHHSLLDASPSGPTRRVGHPRPVVLAVWCLVVSLMSIVSPITRAPSREGRRPESRSDLGYRILGEESLRAPGAAGSATVGGSCRTAFVGGDLLVELALPLDVASVGQRALERVAPDGLERSAGVTDPADPACRHTGDQREVGYVAGDDRPGGHHRPAADADGRDAHRPRTDRRAFADVDPDRLPVVGALQLAVGCDRPREVVVREHDRGPDEGTALHERRLVDQGVVLDLAPVADDHAGPDVGTPADDAALADDGMLTDLGVVPDQGVAADGRAVVDVGGRLDPSRADRHDTHDASESCEMWTLSVWLPNCRDGSARRRTASDGSGAERSSPRARRR